MRFIVQNKVTQMVSYMLEEHLKEGLTKEVVDMIREEVKNVLESKI